ncbi:MAG: bifunctional demethylmenaquinone methyltransferase/2-methoxy-6-polyprenyl-1,4-benzoquinol methylase UbiE [Myxococcota bacterium]
MTHVSLSEGVDGSGQMFDGIARRYDLLNRLNSMGLDQRWRRILVDALQLAPGHRVLDLATGTADLPLAFVRREPELNVVGLDPSTGMLDMGRKKVTKASLDERIELVEGDAQALQFDDASFDRVSMSFGIRNVPDRAKALAEIARVLKPGGRAAILELSVPKNGLMAALARLHIQYFVPAVGALLSGASEYKYLKASIQAFPEPPEFAEMLRTAGLSVSSVRPLTFGACVLYIADAPQGKT